MSSIAEQRAADVSAGRLRLDAGRETLDRYRANELAEAEALSLARIKVDTERALTHQAQALRDAERAAELVAIERRSTDLDAIKEAQRRLVLEQEAQAAIKARTGADALATSVVQEKLVMLAAARQAHHARLEAQREALLARQSGRQARLRLAWLRLRSLSPVVAGVVALLLGLGIGWMAATLQLRAANPDSTDETPLKLEQTLAQLPVRH